MCKVITVANQKGGTAKSVTCLNLGVGLAKAGKKVLLIDADPQGSLSMLLMMAEAMAKKSRKKKVDDLQLSKTRVSTHLFYL